MALVAAFGAFGCNGSADEGPAQQMGGAQPGSPSGGSGGAGLAKSAGGAGGIEAGGAGGADCVDCFCQPGTTQPCYTGDPSTKDVGACASGVSTCTPDGQSWGACVGDVLPSSSESCLTVEDDDCDGEVNEGCCMAGEPVACYTGPSGTEGVGMCASGNATCGANGVPEGPCVGEVVPSAVSCALPVLDDDCDGDANEGCCTSGAWSFSTVATNVGTGMRVKIAVDDAGVTRIGYATLQSTSSTSYVSHASIARRPRGGSWTLAGVSSGDIANGVDFAIDDDGLHAAYTAYNSSFYARPDGNGGWSIETVAGPASQLALALAADGTTQLFRMVSNFNSIGPPNWSLYRYQRDATGTWAYGGEVDGYVLSPRMRVDADGAGRVHMLYGEKVCSQCTLSTLKHGVRNAMGVWSSFTSVGTMANSVFFDVAGAPDGSAHIGFANSLDDYNHQVHASGVMSLGCNSPFCPELTSAPAIAVGPDGHPHAIYTGTSAVHIAHDGTAWTTESLPVTLGDQHALAVDEAGGVHIAHIEGGDLKYGYRCP